MSAETLAGDLLPRRLRDREGLSLCQSAVPDAQFSAPQEVESGV